MKNEKNTTKIGTKIWRPILEKFDKKIEAACLRRDAYLSRVLQIELDCLDNEVPIPNSPVASKFIADRLAVLDCKPVGLTLPMELITRLNAICAVKRISRDAFFNRLLLLLASSPKAIDHLLFQYVGDWDWKAAVKEKFDVPDELYPLSRVSIDPLWAIREGLNLMNEENAIELSEYQEPETGKLIKVVRDVPTGYLPPLSVYTTTFNDAQIKGSDLYGLNCYIADQHIPGHPADAARRKTLDEIFAEL